MKTFVIDNKEFTLIGDHEYEGMATVWGRETVIYVDNFDGTEGLLSLIKEKVDWINEHKQLILDSFMICSGIVNL